VLPVSRYNLYVATAENSIPEDVEAQQNETPIPPASTPLLLSPALWLVAFLALNFAVPFLPISSMGAALIGNIALTFVYVTIVVLFAVGMARLKLPLVHLIALTVLAGGMWFAIDKWLGQAISGPIIAAVRESKTRPDFVQTLQLLSVSTFTDLSLLIGAVCAGNVASRMIKTPNMLGPVCGVIALIDVWGVLFGGIVAQMMEKTPELAAKAMTQGPQIGAASPTAARYAIPMPHIGVGDYLFLGLLFGVLLWHGLNWRSASKWVVGLVSLALLAIALGALPALPGLLFIAIGVAIPNLKAFSYTREEKFALLYALIFVAILTIALYFGITSLLPDKK
jgi:hypothetical protein